MERRLSDGRTEPAERRPYINLPGESGGNIGLARFREGTSLACAEAKQPIHESES